MFRREPETRRRGFVRRESFPMHSRRTSPCIERPWEPIVALVASEAHRANLMNTNFTPHRPRGCQR